MLIVSVLSVLSFFFILRESLLAATSGASEAVVFEKMLSSSVYVDCRNKNFNSFSKFSLFWANALLYFGLTTACHVMSLTGGTNSPIQNRPIQTVTQLISVVFSNALALIGGIYFIYSAHCEGAEFGRHSKVSLPHQSLSNARKISSMKGVTISQVTLAFKAFNLAIDIAARKKSISLRQKADLNHRVCSVPHVYAVATSITQETVDDIVSLRESLLASDSLAVRLMRYSRIAFLFFLGFQRPDDVHFR